MASFMLCVTGDPAVLPTDAGWRWNPIASPYIIGQPSWGVPASLACLVLLKRGGIGQALCAWLEEQLVAGKRPAQALPVFYIQRGRIAEGLHANARLSRVAEKEGARLQPRLCLELMPPLSRLAALQRLLTEI